MGMGFQRIQEAPNLGLGLEYVTSGFVKGFGCRPIAAMRLAPWPASESLQ
jgi:hypothetical protein